MSMAGEPRPDFSTAPRVRYDHFPLLRPSDILTKSLSRATVKA